MAASKSSGGVLGRLFAIILTLFVFAALAAAAWFYSYANQPLATQTPVEFTLKPGSFIRAANHLQEQGLVDETRWFVLLGRITGEAQNIKAGVYRLDKPTTPLELLHKLANGDAAMLSITIVEGTSWRQLRRDLAANPALEHDASTLTDAQLIEKLQLPAGSVEGQFFPDTYFVGKGAGELQLLRRAHERLQQKLDAAWAERAADTPLRNPQEALILASIVEKETGLPSDRPMIASVFVNRLKIGMRLQTDPTVIYGLGDKFVGNLRKIDLQNDTPWNTYTRAGLPPTPISLVSEAALKAAVNPAQSKALYFVAKGDGASHFSQTLDEHNAAVRRYILKR